MNSKKVISAIAAICLSTGGFAFAQGKSDHDDRGDRGRNEQGRGQQDRRDNGARQPQNHEYHDRAYYEERHEVRGAGPNHAFYKGGRLPVEYRHRQYVVDDWRGHNLSAPPRGYQWVQTGGDYVLIAIASGIIASILLSR